MNAVRARRTITLVAAAVVISIATVALLIFSVKRSAHDEQFYYWLEAESALRIEPPLEIVEDATASGGRCVELKEGTGAAIFGQSGGEAVYEIPFPAPGRYVMWGRTYWTDGCGNSFFIRLGTDLLHFGEDSMFEEWHWVSIMLPEVAAARTERITIANREDGVKIDNM
jgi:hypothetical protein